MFPQHVSMGKQGFRLGPPESQSIHSIHYITLGSCPYTTLIISFPIGISGEDGKLISTKKKMVEILYKHTSPVQVASVLSAELVTYAL